MAEWKIKRFWETARVAEADGGYTVVLDGRSVKTPAKSGLIVPTRTLAQEIAKEWDAQVDDVNPETMPLTRAANAAIDKVAHQFDEVASLIAAYGETDLLCYRADRPQELVLRQETAWDPLLVWAKDQFSASLITGKGVMHITQPAQAIERLDAQVRQLTPFQLTAFHDLVSISGSLVLGLAVIHQRLDADSAWAMSRIDETWQAEQWGQDDEALEQAANKHAAMVCGSRFYTLCTV